MSTSPQPAATRWFLLAFLTLLNVVSFIDRQIISALQVPIKGELKLEDLGLGLLSGYAFATFYSVMGLYLGVLADRVNRIRLIAIGLFLWSAMTALSGMARSFEELALARIFVGVGEATLTPAALSMLSEVFPARQRSLAAGIYYMGIPLGVSFAFLLTGMLEPTYGWRNCFLMLGIIGVLLTGVVFLFRDPRIRRDLLSQSPPPRTSIGFGQVFHSMLEIPEVLARSPALVLTMIGGCMLNIAVGATYHDMAWMKVDRHFNPAVAAASMSFYFLIGGGFGNVFGGWFGAWIERRMHVHRLWSVILSLVVCVPVLAVFRLMPPAHPMFWICYAVVSVSVTIYYGPVFSTVLELSPDHLKSTMMAFFLIGMNLLGASLGAVIAPVITSATGSRTKGLLITGLFSVLAVPLFLAAMKMMKHSQDMTNIDTREWSIH